MTPELAQALNELDSVRLGARIKAARTAAGLTQPELGASDASVTYVSRIERGERRAGPTLLAAFASRLGVSLDYLVLGASAEDSRRVELMLDHAELALAGGEAERAMAQAREVLELPELEATRGGRHRAQYVEASALDALGDERAVRAYEDLLAEAPSWSIRMRAATAMSRILRESGQLERAVGCARTAIDELPPGLKGSEEGVRLAVTLAAALFMAGDTGRAAAVCNEAIEDAERLSSPVARASAYWNTSVMRADAGELDVALDLARRALHLLESTERVRDLGRLRTQLSTIMLRADPPRVDDARHQLEIAGRELDWSEASPADRARNDLANARLQLIDGDLVEARRRARLALDALPDALPLIRASVLTLAGQVEWTAGEREQAKDHYRAAIAVLTGIGADREAAQLWFEIGTLADEAGLVDEARDAYRRAAASTGLTAQLPSTSTRAAGSPVQGG